MKRKSSFGKTKKLALAAMLCALGVVLLYIGAIVEVMDLTMVALASLIVFFAVLEMGNPYPYLIALATGFLSMILLPNKFAALLYCFFGGLYPIVKAYIERLPTLLVYLMKIVYFNLLLTGMVWVTVYLMHIEDSGFGFTIGFYALGNLAFFLYDVASTKLITLYLTSLRQRLRVDKYFQN